MRKIRAKKLAKSEYTKIKHMFTLYFTIMRYLQS